MKSPKLAPVALPDPVTDPEPDLAPAKRKGPPIPLLLAVVIATGAGTLYYLHSRGYEETDDAQIDGDISNVSPRVTGTVKAVHVHENQEVKAGDVLLEIDPADYEVGLEQARAAVAQAEALLHAEDPSVPITQASNEATLRVSNSDLASSKAALASAHSDVAQLSAQLLQAEANNRTAQLETRRAERLIAEKAIPQAEYDRKTNAAAAAEANVEAIRQSLESAKEHIAVQEARVSTASSRVTEVRSNAPRQVETRKATVMVRQAGLDLARAQLHQAELNLSYTRLVAPISGIVGKKSVNVGDRIAPGQQLMAISNTTDLWVTANYRETQFQRMSPGQRATLHVDAIDADLSGVVESVAGATGSRFSVLPPENASGNYVKVVQRIPLRIRLDSSGKDIERLRPGMSVEARVLLN